MSRLQRLLAVLVATALLPVGVSAQQRGVITGKVIDSSTSGPLIGVSVTVGGTALGDITNQQGDFRIANVPAGVREVSASVLGYAQQTQTVTVAGGGTATASFQLQRTALEIGGMVVTATGREQRTRELGNAVSTIDVDDVELATVNTMSQLIQGRSAGTVVLQSSGVVGTGSRIRIRGANSMSLANNPLLIVDGVRVYDAEARLGFGVGGQSPSSLDDLNPEDIESIEILKGPAASALYGTAAANGVIQITTRHGHSGTSDFRAWTEFANITKSLEFPDNVLLLGTLVGSTAATGRCDIIRQAIASEPTGVGCSAVTEENRFNPLEAPTSPLQDGNSQVVGASVSGGSDASTFYFSGEYDHGTGILPQNDQRRVRMQANASGRAGENFNVGANIAFLESDLQLPQSDNALFGIFPMGLYGLPLEANIEANDGFLDDPQFAYDWLTFQDLSRFTGSVQSEYRPINWLAFNGNVGLDRYAREEVNRLPRNTVYGAFGPPYENGFIQNFNYDIYNLTTNGSATAVFNVNDDITSTTSVGTQYLRETLHQIYAFGSVLTPGVETSLAGATAFFESGEANTLNATVSAYGQQRLGWRDRLFLSGAVRGDQNTAFGQNLGWIWYPSASASWVIADEPFFPVTDLVSNLRLRAAWGQSGLRPGPTDALQSFGPVIQSIPNGSAPGIVFDAVGNPDLRPEVATEWELGLETGLLSDRLGLDLTYFNKTSHDALVSRPLAPSLGASASRFENLGKVNNKGVELLLTAQALRSPDFSWDVSLSGSMIHNELLDLGVDAEGKPLADIVFGLLTDTQRHKEGYALGSWFQDPITEYADANGDGLLSPSEVTVEHSDSSAVFLGNPFPNRELSFSSNITFRDWIRLSGLLDYKGGHEMMNFTRLNRCELPNSVCEEMYDPNTPLDVQAANVAWNYYNTAAGYVEKADFWKLREVALTFNVPQSVVDRVGRFSGLSLTLAGRNLATWTDYTGFDPEVSFAGQSNFSSGDAGTLPPNRVYTIRVDANF